MHRYYSNIDHIPYAACAECILCIISDVIIHIWQITKLKLGDSTQPSQSHGKIKPMCLASQPKACFLTCREGAAHLCAQLNSLAWLFNLMDERTLDLKFSFPVILPGSRLLVAPTLFISACLCSASSLPLALNSRLSNQLL